MKEQKIAIIGQGNVGSHLYKAFTKAGLCTTLYDSREMKNLQPSDIYIICVKDDVIGEVAEKLSERIKEKECLGSDNCGNSGKSIVVHTAGTKPMSLLEGKFQNYGVLYPMQTFSKEKALTYRDIPLFLEASNADSMARLRTVADKVFDNIRELSSAERKVLHIAAVFTSNFTNHMITLADKELHTIGLDYTVMLPLLKEVTDKLLHLPPQKAQTGPAVRKDLSVVNEHIALIENPQTREIYRIISESIME